LKHFIFLGKLTPQGIAGIKQVEKRYEAFKRLLKSKRGKLIEEYATFGRYDYVIVAELPNTTAALEVSVATGLKGNVTFETLRAFPFNEFLRAVKKA
jgi:uncharacterized protein with GYD domain